VHKATIFYLPGLVASGFSAVKALNCGFGGLLRKAWVLLLWLFFSFCSNPSQVNYHVTSRCSTSRYAPWTVFKSQFCGFAAQIFHKTTT